MTDRQPLEETPEVAAAVEDDTTVPQLMTGGGADDDTPEFREPASVDDLPAAAGDADDLPAAPDDPDDLPTLGDAYDVPTGDGDEIAPTAYRTGADQPWDPEDLAAAEGRDPTPENVERARRELEQDGPAAVERTVP